jgi:hypothetical protein
MEKSIDELEILKDKVNTYETVLHSIQLYHDVTMDHDRLSRLIQMICSWSSAHRQGNGELDNSALVNLQYERLSRNDWK